MRPLPPSLIFAGPAGVGKRLVATALAQALNYTTFGNPGSLVTTVTGIRGNGMTGDFTIGTGGNTAGVLYTLPSLIPAMSCQTKTWASQLGPAPIPTVGIVSFPVIWVANSAGTISITTENAPASATAIAS